MNTGVLRRLILGFGANMFGPVVTAVAQLVGVPLLLFCWGTHLYGEWLILFAIPTYFAMSDLGFSLSAANDMTQTVARGDRIRALSVFQSLCALNTVMCVGLFLMVVVCLTLLPIDHWWHSNDLSALEVRLIILFLSAEFLTHLLDGINHAGFRSNGEYALHTSVTTTVYACQNIGLWGAAMAGFGPLGAAATFFGVRLVGTLGASKMLKMRHGWLHFGYRSSSWGELMRLGKPALANVGQPLASAINIQGMVFVVGALAGPVAVVALSTLRTLTRLLLQLVAAIFNPMEPELAAAYGRGDRGLARTVFCHILRVCVWLSVVACTFLFLTGDWILKIWTAGRVPMDAWLFVLLLFSGVAAAYWQACLVLTRATNRHLSLISLYCAGAVTSIAIAAVILKTSGIMASVGIPMLVLELAAGIYAHISAARMLQMDAIGLFLNIMDPVPVARVLEKLVYRHR